MFYRISDYINKTVHTGLNIFETLEILFYFTNGLKFQSQSFYIKTKHSSRLLQIISKRSILPVGGKDSLNLSYEQTLRHILQNTKILKKNAI